MSSHTSGSSPEFFSHSLSFFFYFLHSELYSELSLFYFANKESEDAYDVSTLFKGWLWAKNPDLRRAQRLLIPISLSWSRPRTKTWMTWHSASCSQRHTEDKPITANEMSVSQSSSVVFDGSGQLDGERNVDQSVVFGVARRTNSAHSKFYENTRTAKMNDESGNSDEQDKSNAQIRTPLEKQRITIIAEYREKVGHHELQATQAEEAPTPTRRTLATKIGISWSSSTKSYWDGGITKFFSSTFDTIARRKLIEGQNTNLELSGRVQELQNEVCCVNDSKDFQDAESYRSGNSDVNNRRVSFPLHPIPEGIVRQPRSRSIHSQWSKVKGQNKTKIWDVSLDSQPKIQSFSVEKTFQRMMEQTNNVCRFLISNLTSSLCQQPLLAGR